MKLPVSPDSVPPLTWFAVDRDALSRSDPARELTFSADPAARVLVVHNGRVAFADACLLMPHTGLPSPKLRAYLGRVPADIAPEDATPKADNNNSGAREIKIDTDGTVSAPATKVMSQIPVEMWLYEDAKVEDGGIQERSYLQWSGFREIISSAESRYTALAVEAIALANWHMTHTYCPRCGSVTRSINGGWERKCQSCENSQFPRMDPAVIMTVTDDNDRILLGANKAWSPKRFSLLAGFVEPGESLEQAVAREVYEEANIEVERVVYQGSQPWPQPASLMIAFRAQVVSGSDPNKVRADGDEIAAVSWFSRHEIQLALQEQSAGEIRLPGQGSIVRWLILEWLTNSEKQYR